MLVPAARPLSPAETEQGLKFVVRDGLTTQAMLTLTGGALLTDFALKLGASQLVIGGLAAIPALAQLLQIPSVYLVERWRNRRALTVYGVVLSRSFLLLLAAIPWVAAGSGIWLMLAALAGHWIFVAVSGCSWNSWMRDLVPEERLGVFFARRMAWAAGLGIPLSLAAGFFIDYWKSAHVFPALQGYAWLFTGGWAAGMLGVYFISRIPEPAMLPDREPPSVVRLLRRPFEDGNFRKLIVSLGLWNFAINLALPFFAVYMLDGLRLPLSRVIAFTVLAQAAYFISLRVWGRYCDRFSNKTVLTSNGLLFLAVLLAWTFTARSGRHGLLYPLLAAIHILQGVSTSGMTLAAGNIGMKIAPGGRATSYLASLNLANSLAMGSAPVLGGKFADFFSGPAGGRLWPMASAPAFLRSLRPQPWDFLFLLAFGLGLYSLQRLSRVRETGEAGQDRLVSELLREMRAAGKRVFSAGSGLRQLMQMPPGRAKPDASGRGQNKKTPSS